MFDALTRLFARSEPAIEAHDPKLAVAALLVHLAAIDGTVTDGERGALKGSLLEHYGLSDSEVDRLVVEATRQDNDSVDYYKFTSAISQLPEDEKIAIVRMMWQVVFADGKNHELEDNMVWRIAELINVSARDRTRLRSEMARA
ncbi:MAG: hypothetical protein JWR75_1570 [Devosia sp.]|jgi:uncharacterized tellurite resistance protein B-like protein|nr:hypothetical protein [Devosia sp.]